MDGNYTDVSFDFEGALDLARRLWALADATGAAGSQRRTLADTALQEFVGRYATEFSQRVDDEQSASGRVGEGLRADAKKCAQLWKDAMDEQNRRLYGRHVDKLKADRNIFQQIGDDLGIGGGFHYPPEPQPVPTPQPPNFAATTCVGV